MDITNEYKHSVAIKLRKDYALVMNFCIKKLYIVKVLVFSLFITFSSPSLKAEMNPKIVALGTMATYGTVGGLMLGVASLAFGTNGRAVAQGASLGLYAGLLFGGYVVGSHAMKNRNQRLEEEGEDYYPDTKESPYESYFFREKLDRANFLKQKLAINYRNQVINCQNLDLNKSIYSNQNSGKKFFLPLISVQF